MVKVPFDSLIAVVPNRAKKKEEERGRARRRGSEESQEKASWFK
jgi:hypothetical protein